MQTQQTPATKTKVNIKHKVAYGSVNVGNKALSLITESIKSTKVSTGPHVPEFERRFADIIGAKHAIATSSGTDACTLMMASTLDFDAQRGDEVILPALTFSATANAILMAGLTPKFVDIDPNTLNIDPNKIEQAMSEKTRAIFPVHMMGKPAPMDEIFTIANKHKLMVFEDACQAHGGIYKNKKIGSFSNGASFSLYAAHLICTGEGGIITTNSDKHADIYRSLRSHGRPSGKLDFVFERVGFNSKMNELEAALGIEACDHYEDIRKRRKYNLDTLRKGIQMLPHANDWLWLQDEEEYETIGPQGLPIIITKNAPFTRDDITHILNQTNIEWKTLFGSLPTQHKAYEFLGYNTGDFPKSEYVGPNGFHIGVHQGITESDLQYVLDTFRTFLAQY